MTLLNTMLVGFGLFSDFGVNGSVTRDPRGDEPEFLNTAWTIQVVRGLLLWIVCIALAGPVAAFYHEPRLRLFLPVVGLSAVIGGFNSTKALCLIRHIELSRMAVFEILTQIVGLIVTAVWALINPSIWALVGGKLVSDFIRMVASHLALPGHNSRLGWEKQSAVSILEFGKWVWMTGIVFFLASQSDRLIVGHLVTLQTLALYGIAFTVADIPRQVILAFSIRVVLPYIAKFSHQSREEYRQVILRYRRITLLFTAIGIAVILNTADLLFVHVYDKRYQPAAWMIPLLAIGLWHTVLYTTSSQGLIALGKTIYPAIGYFLSVFVLYGGVPVAFHHYGLPGAVVVVAFSDLPVYIVNGYGTWKERIPVFTQDAWATAAFVLICGAGAAVRLMLGVSFPSPVWLR
jgi:O-antigen/teichoic acid export membrane protein